MLKVRGSAAGREAVALAACSILLTLLLGHSLVTIAATLGVKTNIRALVPALSLPLWRFSSTAL